MISNLVNKGKKKKNKHKSTDATLWADLPAKRGNYSANPDDNFTLKYPSRCLKK